MAFFGPEKAVIGSLLVAMHSSAKRFREPAFVPAQEERKAWLMKKRCSILVPR
jgi:hypothetical protein